MRANYRIKLTVRPVTSLAKSASAAPARSLCGALDRFTMGRTMRCLVHRGGEVLLLLVGLAGTSCATREVPLTAFSGGPCAPFQSFDVEGAQVVIFPAGSGWVEGYRYGDVQEYWSPASDDIRKAEAVVRSCVAAHLPHRAAEVQLYARQYTGFYMGGRKILFVQLFRDPVGFPNWRCKPVVVDDGGDSYCHLEVDVDRGECQRFWANGSA